MPTVNSSSIVDYLKSQGRSSDLNSRANLAVQYGLSPSTADYITRANMGTNADINTALINKLRGTTPGGGASASSPNFNADAASSAVRAFGATSPNRPQGGANLGPSTQSPTDSTSPAVGSPEWWASMVGGSPPATKTPEELAREAEQANQGKYDSIAQAQIDRNNYLRDQEIEQFNLASKQRTDMMLNSLAQRGVLDNSDTATQELLNKHSREEEGLRQAVVNKYELMNSNISSEYKEKLLDDIQKDIERRTAAQAAAVKDYYDKASLIMKAKADEVEREYKQKQLALDEEYKRGSLSIDEYNSRTNRLKAEADITKSNAETAKIKSETGNNTPGSNFKSDVATQGRQVVSNMLAIAYKNPGIFGATAAIPLPDALRSDAFRDYRALIDSLKGNIIPATLTAMREASKTGGALGQVSDREGAWLASALGALEMPQSPDQVISQLRQIDASLSRWQSAAEQYSGAGGGTAQSRIEASGYDFAAMKAAYPEMTADQLAELLGV